MQRSTAFFLPFFLGLVLAGCNSGSSSDGSSTTASTTSGAATGTTSVGTVLNDDHADSSAGATPIQLVTTGFVINAGADDGVIDSPTDQDWFRVTLDGGVPFRIETDTQGDTALLLFASDGQTLVTSNDDIDANTGQLGSRIRFVPSRTGTFYVAIQAGPNAVGLPAYDLWIQQTN